MVSEVIIHGVVLISLPAGGEGTLHVTISSKRSIASRQESPPTHNRSSSPRGLGVCPWDLIPVASVPLE
jgi:hypothetical protein